MNNANLWVALLPLLVVVIVAAIAFLVLASRRRAADEGRPARTGVGGRTFPEEAIDPRLEQAPATLPPPVAGLPPLEVEITNIKTHGGVYPSGAGGGLHPGEPAGDDRAEHERLRGARNDKPAD